MGIYEISKLNESLLETSFDLENLGRFTKTKDLFLKVELNLYLGMDFLIVSLGSFNKLVSLIFMALNATGYEKIVNLEH